MARERIVVVADVPSPHQNVFFDAVAARDDVDLLVLFCRRTMPGRAWSGEGPKLARHEVLAEAAIAGFPTNPTLLGRLARERDRVAFVIGYYLPSMLAAGIALGATHRPWVFWTDTLPPDEAPLPLRKRARNVIRRWFLERSTFSISTGNAGRTALLARGVPEDRAFSLPFVVDRDRIFSEVERRRGERAAVLTELGLHPARRTLVFVGQMILRKGIDVLLDALAASNTENLQLLLVGEGDDLAAFQARASALGLDARVRFHPYVDNVELPRFWAAADGFVLPSRFDPWPVVIIEALAAAMPIVGTRTCGSVVDGVTPGENGWIVAPEDVADLASALASFAAMDESALAAMGVASRRKSEPWSAAAAAEELVRISRLARSRVR